MRQIQGSTAENDMKRRKEDEAQKRTRGNNIGERMVTRKRKIERERERERGGGGKRERGLSK